MCFNPLGNGGGAGGSGGVSLKTLEEKLAEYTKTADFSIQTISNAVSFNTFDDLPSISTLSANDKLKFYHVKNSTGYFANIKLNKDAKFKGLYVVAKLADGTEKWEHAGQINKVTNLIRDKLPKDDIYDYTTGVFKGTVGEYAKRQLATKLPTENLFYTIIKNDNNTVDTHQLAINKKYLLVMGSNMTASGSDVLQFPQNPVDGDIFELKMGDTTYTNGFNWNCVGNIEGTAYTTSSPFQLNYLFYPNNILNYQYDGTNNTWRELTIEAGNSRYFSLDTIQYSRIPQDTQGEIDAKLNIGVYDRLARHNVYKVASIDDTSSSTAVLVITYGNRLRAGDSAAVACLSAGLNGIYEIVKNQSNVVTVDRIINNFIGLTIIVNNDDTIRKYDGSTYQEFSYPFTANNKIHLQSAYDASLEGFNQTNFTQNAFFQHNELQYNESHLGGSNQKVNFEFEGTSKDIGLHVFKMPDNKKLEPQDHILFDIFDNNFFDASRKTTLEIMLIFDKSKINEVKHAGGILYCELDGVSEVILYLFKKGTGFNGGNPFAEDVEDSSVTFMDDLCIVRFYMHFVIDQNSDQYIYADINRANFDLNNANFEIHYRQFAGYIDPLTIPLRAINNTFTQSEIIDKLNLKVDKVSGKALSDENYTLQEQLITSTTIIKVFAINTTADSHQQLISDYTLGLANNETILIACEHSNMEGIHAVRKDNSGTTTVITIKSGATLKIDDEIKNNNDNKDYKWDGTNWVVALPAGGGGSFPSVQQNFNSPNTSDVVSSKAIDDRLDTVEADITALTPKHPKQPDFFDYNRTVQGDTTFTRNRDSHSHLYVYHPFNLQNNQSFYFNNFHDGYNTNNKITAQVHILLDATFVNTMTVPNPLTNVVSFEKDGTKVFDLKWTKGSNSKAEASAVLAHTEFNQFGTLYVASLTFRLDVTSGDVTEYLKGKLENSTTNLNNNFHIGLQQYAEHTVQPWDFSPFEAQSNYVNVNKIITSVSEYNINKTKTDYVVSAKTVEELLTQKKGVFKTFEFKAASSGVGILSKSFSKDYFSDFNIEVTPKVKGIYKIIFRLPLSISNSSGGTNTGVNIRFVYKIGSSSTIQTFPLPTNTGVQTMVPCHCVVNGHGTNDTNAKESLGFDEAVYYATLDANTKYTISIQAGFWDGNRARFGRAYKEDTYGPVLTGYALAQFFMEV